MLKIRSRSGFLSNTIETTMAASSSITLSKHPFFANIEAARLRQLLESARVAELTRGSVVFDEGAPSDAIYLILSGQVAFRKRLANGDHLTVSVSGQGNHFGEVGVLTGERRSLRAEIESDAVIAKIGGDALRDYLRTLPGPVDTLLQSIIKHLHETTRHYVDDILHREKMAVVGAMVNSIIHDFKNPFCLISMSAQILRHRSSSPDVERLCDNIENQVERMVEMARELSEFSRGETRLDKKRLNLRDVLGDFKRLNNPFFENENIRIEMDVPAVEFMGERGKMLRVFQNLVGNAIEAFGEKGGKIEITGEVLAKERAVEVRIRDDGGGIPEEIRDRFFDPFVTHGKREGTGLGSAIVKSIVDAHGGRISFRTETNVGTIFFIRLPLA